MNVNKITNKQIAMIKFKLWQHNIQLFSWIDEQMLEKLNCIQASYLIKKLIAMNKNLATFYDYQKLFERYEITLYDKSKY